MRRPALEGDSGVFQLFGYSAELEKHGLRGRALAELSSRQPNWLEPKALIERDRPRFGVDHDANAPEVLGELSGKRENPPEKGQAGTSPLG